MLRNTTLKSTAQQLQTNLNSTRTVLHHHFRNIDYKDGQSLQNYIQRLSIDNRIHEEGSNDGYLLTFEFKPVYTEGKRNGTLQPDLVNRLTNLGADYYQTDRGGKTTFHGPGQLVVYPIVNLKQLDLGIRNYVTNLEKTVIDLAKLYDIEAKVTDDTGVWVNEDKLAAIGVNCKRYITSHGLALNCNTDLHWFNNIVPCGLIGKGTTSLTKILNTKVTVENCLPKFINAFETNFKLQVLNLKDEDSKILRELDELIKK